MFFVIIGMFALLFALKTEWLMSAKLETACTAPLCQELN